jgi:hypothetical protein
MAMNAELTHLLLGKHIKSNKRHQLILERIDGQQSFDELLAIVFHHEKQLAIRAAEAIDEITRKHPEFLVPHKAQLLTLLTTADHHEIKWHIAQWLPRIPLLDDDLGHVWRLLSYWAHNPNEGKIIRVHALQALHELSTRYPSLEGSFREILITLEKTKAPALQTAINKLKGKPRV